MRDPMRWTAFALVGLVTTEAFTCTAPGVLKCPHSCSNRDSLSSSASKAAGAAAAGAAVRGAERPSSARPLQARGVSAQGGGGREGGVSWGGRSAWGGVSPFAARQQPGRALLTLSESNDDDDDAGDRDSTAPRPIQEFAAATEAELDTLLVPEGFSLEDYIELRVLAREVGLRWDLPENAQAYNDCAKEKLERVNEQRLKAGDNFFRKAEEQEAYRREMEEQQDLTVDEIRKYEDIYRDQLRKALVSSGPKLITFEVTGVLLDHLETYGEVLRECLHRSLRMAIRLPGPVTFERAYSKSLSAMEREYPDQGIEDGISSPVWWFNVIQDTYGELLEQFSFPEETLEASLDNAFYDFYYSATVQKNMWMRTPYIVKTLLEFKRWRDKDGGPMLGVVTDWDGRVHTLLYNYGLDRFFDFVIKARDVNEAKPSPGMFELALKKAGCEPREAMHVGNSMKDVKAAREAGFGKIYVVGEPPFPMGKSLPFQAIPYASDLWPILRGYRVTDDAGGSVVTMGGYWSLFPGNLPLPDVVEGADGEIDYFMQHEEGGVRHSLNNPRRIPNEGFIFSSGSPQALAAEERQREEERQRRKEKLALQKEQLSLQQGGGDGDASS